MKKQSYTPNHPGESEILFIAELAQASLEKDRTVKVKLYAEADLQEYWIVNLRNRKIEVYLQPDSEQGLYASMNHYDEGATFASPFAGEVVVADLLSEEE
ncbi:MAG: Uma2 family endonuclease [Lewinella sp.]